MGRVAAGFILRSILGFPQQVVCITNRQGQECKIAMWLATCIACQVGRELIGLQIASLANCK